MYPEKKGGSHKMARRQQNWGLLTLLTRWASIWTMPNTASPKSEPPCGRAVYTPVGATILGHPPQKTAPRGEFHIVITKNLQYKTHPEFWPSPRRIFKTSLYYKTRLILETRRYGHLKAQFSFVFDDLNPLQIHLIFYDELVRVLWGNGLMPSTNKPMSGPMMTNKFCDDIWSH